MDRTIFRMEIATIRRSDRLIYFLAHAIRSMEPMRHRRQKESVPLSLNTHFHPLRYHRGERHLIVLGIQFGKRDMGLRVILRRWPRHSIWMV